MKTILTAVCMIIIGCATAQTKVEKSYPVKPGQKVELAFDYPKLVRISTWDKNEVSVTAMVSINEGDNDDAFVLENEQSADGSLSIRNHIKDMKNLPKMYTIVRAGKKTTFRTKEAYHQFISENGRSGNQMTSEGVDMEITVEVKVPANTATHLNAKYGIVEMKNFNAPATVSATYGGIDASITPATTGKLQATTHYGQMYTNLDLTLTSKSEKDFYSSITAEPGKGHAYILKSTYGNLYLRKQ
jgi:hypothetical protein